MKQNDYQKKKHSKSLKNPYSLLRVPFSDKQFEKFCVHFSYFYIEFILFYRFN